MKIIHTDEVDYAKLKPQEREWVYNGLDCTITAEILEVLLSQLDNSTAATYVFSRELQGPVLEMRLRGVLVDKARRAEVIEEWYELQSRLESDLETILGEGLGLHDFNWRSNSDLNTLFYRTLGVPPIKRGGRATVDRDALEKLESYFAASLLARYVSALRELGKKIAVLKTEIDSDGRIRTSYNIAGTTTGRLSSSFSEFGTGTNLQNIEESLRSIFIADPGYKLAYLDAEQGESRVVGAIEWNLLGDGKYLDVCESGDLHTTVAKLVWPGLAWTDDPAMDRALAEQPYYRHYDRRFMCKKLGHGSNYGGKPRTLSNQTRVEESLVTDFQSLYFKAFPAHRRWHQDVDFQLRSTGHLVTLTGRKRWFLGRRDDDATLREAIAYDPQGSLADILNRGMLAVWRNHKCQLLMQVHDAILIQYPEEAEAETLDHVQRSLRSPIRLSQDRPFIIPYGVATGWNWGKCTKDNPDGLKTWQGKDDRRRTPPTRILDRRFRTVHGWIRQSRSIPKVGGNSHDRRGP